MEKLDYVNVSSGTTEELKTSENTVSRKSLLRQIFMCSGVWASYFTFGLSFGSPTVVIAQIRREANSTDAVSPELASWLSSAYNYGAIINSIVLVYLARAIGRKRTFLLVAVISLIGYVIFYYSTSMIQILISEIVHGPLTACLITISIMVLTECVSPRYRGMFMTIKSASYLWGIWVSNAIGTFYHWKNIGILGFVTSLYFLTTACFWPESPYWLANNGRFKECAEAHRWLKGFTKESEEELEYLIQSRQNCTKTDGKKSGNVFKKYIKMMISKAFYKPFLLSMLVLALYGFSGKIACAMYVLDIIKKITKSESTAYSSMLILDGITVLGMYVGCFVSKIVSRRSLLLVSSTIGIAFMISLSLYLYLINFGFINEDPYISVSLLIGYSMAISVGPMIMSTTILGELIPLKYRSSSLLAVAVCGHFMLGSILKIFPFIVMSAGIQGLFLFFTITASFFAILTYKCLPETKDKTLLEIQESLLGTSKDETKGVIEDADKL